MPTHVNRRRRPPESPRQAAFVWWFGLQAEQARILDQLTREPIPRTRLLTVQVVAIRSAMEAEAIDTQRGSYVITSAGIEECQSAIDRFAAELRPDKEVIRSELTPR